MKNKNKTPSISATLAAPPKTSGPTIADRVTALERSIGDRQGHGIYIKNETAPGVPDIAGGYHPVAMVLDATVTHLGLRYRRGTSGRILCPDD